MVKLIVATFTSKKGFTCNSSVTHGQPDSMKIYSAYSSSAMCVQPCTLTAGLRHTVNPQKDGLDRGEITWPVCSLAH